MKKEYAVFVKEFNQALTDETGYSKNRIYFKEKDEYPRTVGDRVFVEFSIGEETKEVCGLYIRFACKGSGKGNQSDQKIRNSGKGQRS